MLYHHYDSPLGPIILAADNLGLTGLWLEGQAHGDLSFQNEAELPIFLQAGRWLDLYFSRQEPDFTIPLHLIGTPFQQEVWAILQTIPYGQVTTYGTIARQIAAKQGLPRMSAQAVGGAVGRNPVSIIVPCHRVVGSAGSLTGYAGGLDKKIALLTLEGMDPDKFKLPQKTDNHRRISCFR